jgi:general stress protein 26
MATPDDLKHEFWSELEDSPFVMLGLSGAHDAHTQPMTAQFDEDLPNRLYFYTNRQNRLVQALHDTHDAVLSFAAKGHDLFACVHGRLSVDQDRAVIDRFWSPIVAAWYEDGKDDPDLTLIRFDMGSAEIWTASSGDFLHYIAASLLHGTAEAATEGKVVKTHF